jgi:hypothetical protein
LQIFLKTEEELIFESAPVRLAEQLDLRAAPALFDLQETSDRLFAHLKLAWRVSAEAAADPSLLHCGYRAASNRLNPSSLGWPQ